MGLAELGKPPKFHSRGASINQYHSKQNSTSHKVRVRNKSKDAINVDIMDIGAEQRGH